MNIVGGNERVRDCVVVIAQLGLSQIDKWGGPSVKGERNRDGETLPGRKDTKPLIFWVNKDK